MLLIYFVIFCLQDKIQSLNFQENAEIELTIFCYENKQPIKYCDSGNGYRNCGIKLHFCVSNIYKEDGRFHSQWCDLFDKIYQIKNTKGMCKKGKHDTRGELRHKMNFPAFLQNKTKIYLQISLVTEAEKRPYDKSLLSYNLNDDINEEIISMENEINISEELIKIKLQRKITCLKNFHGNLCEKYCINPNDISPCKIKEADICTKDWFNKNCSHSEFKGKINQCDYINNQENCEEELRNCLNMLKCEKLNSTIDKASLHLSEAHSDKTDPYLKFLVKVIMIIGGGLLVIIFILLATVLLMWKINKREVIRIYRNSRDHIYRYSSRQNIPLPTVKSRDSNYSSIGSAVGRNIHPTRP